MRALAAASEVGLPLVVVGPEKDAAVARELRERGATLRGQVSVEELAALYRGAACLVQASRYEGFGLPVLEAMASGTPVVITEDKALVEVAGGAAVVVPADGLADGIRSALDGRDGARGGRPRARQSLLGARLGRANGCGLPGGARTMTISAVVVSHRHAAELEVSLAALAPQVDEVVVISNVSGSSGVVPAGTRVLENSPAAQPRRQCECRDRGDHGVVRPLREPGRRRSR